MHQGPHDQNHRVEVVTKDITPRPLDPHFKPRGPRGGDECLVEDRQVHRSGVEQIANQPQPEVERRCQQNQAPRGQTGGAVSWLRIIATQGTARPTSQFHNNRPDHSAPPLASAMQDIRVALSRHQKGRPAPAAEGVRNEAYPHSNNHQRRHESHSGYGIAHASTSSTGRTCDEQDVGICPEPQMPGQRGPPGQSNLQLRRTLLEHEQ